MTCSKKERNTEWYYNVKQRKRKLLQLFGGSISTRTNRFAVWVSGIFRNLQFGYHFWKTKRKNDCEKILKLPENCNQVKSNQVITDIQARIWNSPKGRLFHTTLLINYFLDIVCLHLCRIQHVKETYFVIKLVAKTRVKRNMSYKVYLLTTKQRHTQLTIKR